MWKFFSSFISGTQRLPKKPTGAAVFLASRASNSSAGVAIPVDGGSTAF